MSLDAFEEGFPRIFRSYWTNLGKDANNDRERTFVRFMSSNSKQHFITRRICESFGPEDKRAATFAKLEKQREERFFLLERFLKRDQGENDAVEDVSCPDDDELEFVFGYDYSDVRDLKDFVLGKAFTKFQIQMQRFVSTEEYKVKPIGLAEAAICGRKIVEARVFSSDYWGKHYQHERNKPLELLGNRRSKMEEKRVTLYWQCVSLSITNRNITFCVDLFIKKCGTRFREDVVEHYPGFAEEIIQQHARDADEYDIEKQDLSTERAATQDSSLSEPSFSLSSSKNVETCPSNLKLDEKCDEKKANEEASDQGRWVLLCLPGNASYEVHHTCVKTARCNQAMYKQLHARYHSAFRRGIRWLTMHKLEFVDFVRVSYTCQH